MATTNTFPKRAQQPLAISTIPEQGALLRNEYERLTWLERLNEARAEQDPRAEGQPVFSKSSYVVYKSMWSKFERFVFAQTGLTDGPDAPSLAKPVSAFEADRALSQVDADMVARFLEHVGECSRAPGEKSIRDTQARFLSLLSQVLGYMSRAGGLRRRGVNPCDEVKKRLALYRDSPRDSLPTILSIEDEAALVRFLGPIPNANDFSQLVGWAMMRAVLASGMKLSEVIELTNQDISFTDAQNQARLADVDTSVVGRKTGHAYAVPAGTPVFKLPGSSKLKPRNVTCSPTFVADFRTYLTILYRHRQVELAAGEPFRIFPRGIDDPRSWAKVAIHQFVSSALKTAGLSTYKAGLQLLRDSFATRQLELGMPREAFMQLMGLSDPATADRYLSARRVDVLIANQPQKDAHTK